MATLQMIGNPGRANVTRPSHVQDFLFDFRRCSSGILGACATVDECLPTILFVSSFPSIEYLSGDFEVAARLGDIADLKSVVQDPKFLTNILFCLRHTLSSAQKMLRIH